MDNNQQTGTITGLEGEYDIVGELGRGGISVVYLARERLLGREVAIKVIRDRYLRDNEAVARMEREAHTLASIHHPHIVTLYGARRLPDGGLALVMQHLCGDTLRDSIRKNGPFSPERTERVLREVASALAYLHDRGIIHRDVKPENLFVEAADDRTVLSDFGLAKGLDGLADVTLTGSVIGTPAYMSPEQIDGSELDGRSDLYSLGLVGYELLTGTKPWEGEGLYSVIFKQKHESLPPLEQVCPEVPEPLRHAIERSLEKNRDQRWMNARELLAHLDGRATTSILALKVFAAPAATTRQPELAPSATPTISLPPEIIRAMPVPVQPPRRRFFRSAPPRLAAAAVVVIAIAGAGLLVRGYSPAAAVADQAVPFTRNQLVSPSGGAPAGAPQYDQLPATPEVVAIKRPASGDAATTRPLRESQPPTPRAEAGSSEAPLPEFDAAETVAVDAAPTSVTLREAGVVVRDNPAVRAAPAPLSMSRSSAPAPDVHPALTVSPRLRNPEGVRSRMERLYAAQLRSRGVNGSVDLELGIDEAGRVISASVAASSGYDILDAAALKLTEAMRFSPAEASGKPVPASVRVPITFSESNSPSASDAPAPRSTGVLPKLLNPEEVQQALWSAYPNQLKRTGTGGTVRLRIDVDEAGKIVGTSISKGSGHAALDTAALQVVQMMRFAPAREQGARVNAAVEVPVTFQRRPRS